MSLRDSVTFAGVMRDAHRLTGHLAIWTALLAAVLIAVEPLRRNRLVRSIVLGATLFLVVLVSSFTGYLLPWDQLALWAVTVGTDMRGYAVLRDHQVRFVLLGGKEIGTGTLLRWVGIHMVLGASAVVLAAAAGRRLRSSTAS